MSSSRQGEIEIAQSSEESVPMLFFFFFIKFYSRGRAAKGRSAALRREIVAVPWKRGRCIYFFLTMDSRFSSSGFAESGDYSTRPHEGLPSARILMQLDRSLVSPEPYQPFDSVVSSSRRPALIHDRIIGLGITVNQPAGKIDLTRRR